MSDCAASKRRDSQESDEFFDCVDEEAKAQQNLNSN